MPLEYAHKEHVVMPKVQFFRKMKSGNFYLCRAKLFCPPNFFACTPMPNGLGTRLKDLKIKFLLNVFMQELEAEQHTSAKVFFIRVKPRGLTRSLTKLLLLELSPDF